MTIPLTAGGRHFVRYPETKAVIGGFSIINVTSHEEALGWAAKIAAACRCVQEVQEIMYDPDS